MKHAPSSTSILAVAVAAVLFASLLSAAVVQAQDATTAAVPTIAVDNGDDAGAAAAAASSSSSLDDSSDSGSSDGSGDASNNVADLSGVSSSSITSTDDSGDASGAVAPASARGGGGGGGGGGSGNGNNGNNGGGDKNNNNALTLFGATLGGNDPQCSTALIVTANPPRCPCDKSAPASPGAYGVLQLETNGNKQTLSFKYQGTKYPDATRVVKISLKKSDGTTVFVLFQARDARDGIRADRILVATFDPQDIQKRLQDNKLAVKDFLNNLADYSVQVDTENDPREKSTTAAAPMSNGGGNKDPLIRGRLCGNVDKICDHAQALVCKEASEAVTLPN